MSGEKKLNAAQKIEALEKLVAQQQGVSDAQSQNIQFLAREVDG